MWCEWSTVRPCPYPLRRNRRQRGRIEELRSGALRVSVYAGTEPLTGRRHYLRVTIPASSRAEDEAQKALRRLANQVDERRNPRTSATVNQLLDGDFELAELEESTLVNYRNLVTKHIRPLIGTMKVEALDGTCSTLSTPTSGAAGTTATGGRASTTARTARTSAISAASLTSAARCQTGASATSTSSSAAR
jgi:hypothetical protein